MSGFGALTKKNRLLTFFRGCSFDIQAMDGDAIQTGAVEAFVCVISGTVGGLIIGLVTEYYTSHSYAPVREVCACVGVCMYVGVAMSAGRTLTEFFSFFRRFVKTCNTECFVLTL